MFKNNLEVEILWIAESGYHSDSSLEEHMHNDYYQFHYILEGNGTFLINNESVPFHSNMLFFVKPGTSHGIEMVQVDENSIMRMLEVKFISSGDNLSSELNKLPPYCFANNELQSLLYQSFIESVQPDIYSEQLSTYLFLVWLYQIIRLCKFSNQNLDGKQLRPQPVVQTMSYLDEHLSEEISLDTIATVTGYTKNYLCHIFRERTGMTINTYLNTVRINKAAELLINTDLALAEIAEQCGYNSIHYFIKTFKKIIGISPGNYRRSELTGAHLVHGEVESVSSVLRAPSIVLTHTAQKNT